jgi:predicted RNA-binding Zn-ribbon protein involved in translation (DUF1610 family)
MHFFQTWTLIIYSLPKKSQQRCRKEVMRMLELKECYACPRCGRVIKEKRAYFVCPHCGRALCEKQELETFPNKYCGFCGGELASAVKETLANEK